MTGGGLYLFATPDEGRPGTLPPSSGGALSSNTLNKRLRLLGIDTKTDHCAHWFRTTFSTLSHHEESKDAKARDGDVVKLQLAHLDNSTVEGLYKKQGPLALIGSRTKLMQHWADRIDHWLDPKKVMPIKGGAQGWPLPSEGKDHTFESCRVRHFGIRYRREIPPISDAAP
jgi:hypothetical protein